jgi:glycosyltransferase involved in cell wall biosynthesis
MISVIIPASNEEAYIGPCLSALFASAPVPGGAEAIVVANGCRDRTVAVAHGFAAAAVQAGWRLVVLDQARGSKPLALDAGDAAATGRERVYLDADVVVSPALIGQLAAVLAGGSAVYASGTPHIPRANSWVTRAYARFWQLLPFNQTTAPGYGLFAVNGMGRARWGNFPAIISDDTFVRLQFDPQERHQCPASYDWPMIEGFAALTRVRRRQDAGVAEINRLYPGLTEREAKSRLSAMGLARLALRDPVGFGCYAAVSLAVRLGRKSAQWTRGR